MITPQRKPVYPVSSGLREYLTDFGREQALPLTYADLRAFRESTPLLDKSGRDTLWQSVLYYSFELPRIHDGLKNIYALLKSGGDQTATEHLYVDRIDFCSFGNSEPFRIRIVNAYNENQDYYYIKQADASRLYGLELEHLLSPNRMHFLTEGPTLIEEHVAGVPGDIFVRSWLHNPQVKIIRLAKELVKFNERCFIRLLGDMRSCNFVIDLTPDVEETQIRIRPMDFDQQSYHERMNHYRPQFFKENKELVMFCIKHLNTATARQYQREEQSLILRRMRLASDRLARLLEAMTADRLSTPEKVHHLRKELAEYHGDDRYLECNRMGALVRHSLATLGQRLDPDSALVGDL